MIPFFLLVRINTEGLVFACFKSCRARCRFNRFGKIFEIMEVDLCNGKMIID